MLLAIKAIKYSEYLIAEYLIALAISRQLYNGTQFSLKMNRKSMLSIE